MQAYCAYILHLSICIAVSKNNYLLKTIDKCIDKFIIFKKIIAANSNRLCDYIKTIYLSIYAVYIVHMHLSVCIAASKNNY